MRFVGAGLGLVTFVGVLLRLLVIGGVRYGTVVFGGDWWCLGFFEFDGV